MTFELYRDKNLKWRWRLVAKNGKIIADSGEGYHNKQDCRKMIRKIRCMAIFAGLKTKMDFLCDENFFKG
jgi:uncharacterized protein